MRNTFLILLAAAGLFASCQQNKQAKKTIDSVAENVVKENPQQTCYMQTMGRDTISLVLNQVGDDLSGMLAYDNFEKDSSSGEVKGKMMGDTLVLEYTFQSEGMLSKSQVAFLRKDNRLIQGFGDIEEKDGKVMFKNLKTLKYDEQSVVLTPTDCSSSR